jgi:hypothetical protein
MPSRTPENMQPFDLVFQKGKTPLKKESTELGGPPPINSYPFKQSRSPLPPVANLDQSRNIQ